MTIKYIGISNGKEYEVQKIDRTKNTALCQIENCIGLVRCGFEKFKVKKITL